MTVGAVPVRSARDCRRPDGQMSPPSAAEGASMLSWGAVHAMLGCGLGDVDEAQGYARKDCELDPDLHPWRECLKKSAKLIQGLVRADLAAWIDFF